MSAFVPPENQASNGGNRNRNRNNQQKRVRRSDSAVGLDAQQGGGAPAGGNGGRGSGGGGGGRGGGGGNAGNRPVQQQQVNFNVNSLKNMLGVTKSGGGDAEEEDDDDADEMDVGGLMTAGDPTLMSHMTGAKFGDIVGASVLTKRAIADVMKYTFMTQVQKESIPEILKGKDVFVKAKTGTGKTLAFLIPAIEVLIAEKFVYGSMQLSPATCARPMVLVLSPTRELAQQIGKSLMLWVPTPI